MTVDVAQLRHLAAEATEGEWFHNGHGSVYSKPLSDEYDRVESQISDTAPEDDPAWAALPDPRVAYAQRDAEFIAACRSAVPELLDLLDDATQALAALLDPPDWATIRFGPISEWNIAAANYAAKRDRARRVLGRIRQTTETP